MMDTPNNSSNSNIVGLMPSTNYTIYLSAFTGAGEGNFSDSITVMTILEGKIFYIYVM